MVRCLACQFENPAASRFCSNCGAKLPAAGETDATLKVVTVLFSDVADSTALGEQLDPESLREVLGRYFRRVSATIERHGGTVQKYAGDAVLAVFGIPQVHEDDPLRAVRAAVEIHEQVPLVAEEVGVRLTLRSGLNTGLVISDQGKNLALGDAVNLAARLQQAAKPGEIVLGAQTLRVVRDAVEVEPLEPLTLKGKTEAVEAYRLIAIDSLSPGVARRLDLALVNRDHELARLNEVWHGTVRESRCHIVTLLGTAGVGKSRLAEELLGAVAASATVLRGRCLNYGEGITFWPIIEALKAAGPAADTVLGRLSEGGVGTAEELFLEVRMLLEALARHKPVILFVDDLQWAEPTLIDLLAHIADLSSGAPILILCTARPDLLELHRDWTAARANATGVSLEPLVRGDCERLLDQLGSDLDPEARAHVIRASEGNPLFVEEMVALAREQGIGELPMTIHSLLAARIERLDVAERELLTRGAVEGQVFHRSAVAGLAGEPSGANVDSDLVALVNKDLIRPHRSDVSGDRAFRFRHMLIRDVAYERLPRARRADLHERHAAWIERQGSSLAEHEELAGWHLEQAVLDREHARRQVDGDVKRRAATHLHAAARHAADRGDMVAARKLLERALALAPADDPIRLELIVALAERLVEVGDLARADELLAGAEADHPDDPSVWLVRLLSMVHVRFDEARAIYDRDGERMLGELKGNERALANLRMLGFWMNWMASQALPAAELARRAAEHARSAGDFALRSQALGWYVATLVFGPASVEQMAAELDRIEAEHPGPYLQSFIDLGRGEVARLQARFDDAITLTLRAREGFRALGISTMAATSDQSLGWIELSAGDPAAAVASLERSDAILAEFGERSIRSTTQAMLALAATALGRGDEARRAVEQAETLSSPSDLLNFTLTNGTRARLALSDGDPMAAERWAQSAVGSADGTDFVSYQAQARMLLAIVLAEQASEADAAVHAQAALDLFRSKGDRPGLALAEELLARVRC